MATLALWLLTYVVSAGDPPEVGRISVVVTGLQDAKGSVRAALWRDGDGFPGPSENGPWRGASVAVTGKRAELAFDRVPYGTYAISVFHDLDDDGELDTNWIGIPAEPVGASNNARGSFGPPAWEDARFSLDAPVHRQVIALESL